VCEVLDLSSHINSWPALMTDLINKKIVRFSHMKI
jgi:hypothetical protein